MNRETVFFCPPPGVAKEREDDDPKAHRRESHQRSGAGRMRYCTELCQKGQKRRGWMLVPSPTALASPMNVNRS